MAASKLSRADAILLASMLFILPSIADGLYKESLYRVAPAFFWLADALKFVVVPVLVLVWLRLAFHVGAAQYGLRVPVKDASWLRMIGASLLIAVVLNFVYRTISRIAGELLRPELPMFSLAATVPEGAMHWPIVVYLAFTAGLTEEIFVRGLPLLYLKERFGDRLPQGAYVVCTAALFALTHWENGANELVATFAFGVLAAAIYLNLRTLGPLIVAHWLIDLWAFG